MVNQKLVGFAKVAVAASAMIASALLASPALAATPTIVSAKITGPNTATIVFSEPVVVHTEDWFFGGQLLNRNIVSTQGNTTDTVTITFGGNPVPAGTTGTLYIAATTIAMSNQAFFAATMITLADGQTNTSSTNSTSNTSIGTYSITATPSTPGVLRPGDRITFNLTPNPVKTGARVTGSYNSVPLTWTSIAGGESYQAIYTVGSGDASQTSPLQISGVILTDSSGLASAAISGSDVGSTIDTVVNAISETTKVPSPANPLNLAYTFYSSKPGVINYGGDCIGQTTSANAGQNTIKFKELPEGTYSNCIMNVTDYSGKTSNLLKVSPFAIGSALLAQTYNYTAPTPSPTPTPAPAPSSSFKFTLALKVGSRGNEITELQKRLIAGGFLTGAPTGYFGSLTKKAVMAFQAKNGIAPLGNVGPATRAALNR